jgi:hypothetical protein
MNRTLALFVLALLSACAAQDRAVTQDTKQAVIDFIEVRELAETDKIRISSRDKWDKIDQNFLLYEAKKEVFLIEFARRCHELDEYPVIPDERKTGSSMHAGFDTLRGCRIAKIFPLSEGEIAELKAIGESPGSRN